jgi:carboxymethylenebutenolidase
MSEININTQMVGFPGNGGAVPGYVASPEGQGPFPGLVVIQEWWGLVPHIKEVAERFAREGFVALAPDLYHGQKAEEPDEARKLAMELDRERAVSEIGAALRYLGALGTVASSKLGVVGWCMGGGLSAYTAASGAPIRAAVVFYGMPRDAEMVKDIRVPVLGLYGENDQGIPVERVHAFERALSENDVTHEITIYPGAGHAFFNDTRPDHYNQEAAQHAWEKTLGWFRSYLS